MAQRTRWRDLSAGLIAFLAIVAFVAFVLKYARVGKLHGDTFVFYVTTQEARGVIPGSEVWLDGQKVGQVKGIEFAPPGSPPQDQVLMRVEVLEAAHQAVRADSRAQVRSGGSLIGAPVVYINTGTARARVIAANDTLHSLGQTDVEGVTSDVAVAAREFPAIISNVKLLAAQLTSARSTLGALGIERGGPDLANFQKRLSHIMERVTTPSGTMGRVLTGDLKARANHAMAQADSLRALVTSDRTSLGRFRRDSTLKGQIAAVRDELANIRRLASDSTGTIGRAQNDSALRHAVSVTISQLNALLADLKKHPFRYIVF